MATTSTLGLARAALTAQLDTGDLAGKVTYAWPGPQIAKGRHEALWIHRVVAWTHAIPNIKAGRKQRQETYTFELVLWVARPEVGADGHAATDARALELLAVAEDALADDVQLDEARIQWMQLRDLTHELVPYETGWGCMIAIQVEGHARLT